MREDITAWALASLCYDEENFPGIIELFFKTSRYRMWKKENGSQFYGFVMINDDIWIFIRGTDGDNLLGKAEAWLSNLNLKKGNDGQFDGFQNVANEVFDNIKRSLYGVGNIYIVGHSQGAGIAQNLVKLVAENIGYADELVFYLYASPPAGNQIFYDRIKVLSEAKKIRGYNYSTPGDPVCSDKLRRKDAVILDGCDIGQNILLPGVITYFSSVPLCTIQHSPQVYTIAMMIREISLHALDKIDRRVLMDLEAIRVRLVN